MDATSPPEELFVPLSKFLTSFSEYHHQLWMENEAEEQVKRQTIARTYFAKKSKLIFASIHAVSFILQIVVATRRGTSSN